MIEMRNAYRILVGKLKVTGHLGCIPGHALKVDIKIDLK
jgi:hypothetical protein